MVGGVGVGLSIPLADPCRFLDHTINLVRSNGYFCRCCRCVCRILGLVSNYTPTCDQLPPFRPDTCVLRITASVSDMAAVDNIPVSAVTWPEVDHEASSLSLLTERWQCFVDNSPVWYVLTRRLLVAVVEDYIVNSRTVTRVHSRKLYLLYILKISLKKKQ